MSADAAAGPVEHAAHGLHLGKPIGPLPAGAWLVAILGGLGVAYFVRSRANNAATPAPVAAVPDPTGGLGGATTSPATAGNLYQPGVYGPGPVPIPPITSNLNWRRAAVAALIAAGTEPAAADAACTGYIKGRNLTAAQTAIVSQAMSLVGPTPQPVPHPVATPPPPHKPHRAVDNHDWRGQARLGLIGRGYKESIIVAAFDRWFAGDQLTGPQRAIVDTAIAMYGPPPHPPTHKPTHGHPAPLPTVPPPHRRHTGADPHPQRTNGS